jgi:hypothetical protein
MKEILTLFEASDEITIIGNQALGRILTKIAALMSNAINVQNEIVTKNISKA